MGFRVSNKCSGNCREGMPWLGSAFPRLMMLHKYFWERIREKGREKSSGRQASWRRWEPQGDQLSFCQVVALMDLTAC